MRRGQVNLGQVTGIVLILAAAMIVLSIMTGVNEDIRDASNQKKTFAVNQTINYTGGGDFQNHTLTTTPYDTLTAIQNQSSGAALRLTEDYTLYVLGNGPARYAIVGINNTEYNNTNIDILYNAVNRTEVYNATQSGVQGGVDLGSQFGNIGTIVALALVITLLGGLIFVFRK